MDEKSCSSECNKQEEKILVQIRIRKRERKNLNLKDKKIKNKDWQVFGVGEKYWRDQVYRILLTTEDISI